MERIHDRSANAPWRKELEELVDLVEVVLRLDVVSLRLVLELQDGCKGDGAAVKGHKPNGEDLGDGYVEDEVFAVEGCVDQ